jgi:hypothetical protein
MKGMGGNTLGDGLTTNPSVQSSGSARFGEGFERGEEELAPGFERGEE